MSNAKTSLDGNIDCKQKIIEMVSQTENVDYLEFIYNMMMAFRDKWGM